MNGVFELLCCALLRLVQAVYFVNGSNLQSTPAVMRQLRLKKVKRNDNLYSGVSNRSRSSTHTTPWPHFIIDVGLVQRGYSIPSPVLLKCCVASVVA